MFSKSLSLAVLIVGISAVHGDLTIVQKTEGGINSGELTLRIKGDKARTDVAPQITMLTELSSGDSTTLNHNAKIYIRIPGVEAAKLRAIAADLKPGAAGEAPKLTNTGRKEKVENRECEVFTWSVGNLRVTDWIAKDYPNWQSVYSYFRSWRDDGSWQRIHDTLRAVLRRQAGRHKQATAGCLDSQSLKTSAGPGVRG